MKKALIVFTLVFMSILVFSCSEEEISPDMSNGTTSGVQSDGTEGDF